ncbi:MAG: hypothetical protein AAF702_25285 [Chloroflexota bacterium]
MNQSDDPKRLQYFARALQAEEEDSLICPEVEALLPEYRHAVWMHQQKQPEWQDVTRHLAACPSCGAQYEMMVELEIDALAIDIESESESVEPELYPSLQTNQPETAEPHDEEQRKPLLSPSFWKWDMTTLFVDLGAALQNAMPQQRMAPQGFRATDSNSSSAVYEFAIDGLGEANIFMTIEQSTHKPNEYGITIQVKLPSDGSVKSELPQFSETEATLHIRGSGSHTQLVDGLGEVYFKVAQSDLESISLEIVPDS